ncbi:hypothetical protein PM082_021601 [Marasmius tenuissimus]|nr:hypothetical protein PM082_021601 [Marasmius tenuissimus]
MIATNPDGDGAPVEVEPVVTRAEDQAPDNLLSLEESNIINIVRVTRVEGQMSEVTQSEVSELRKDMTAMEICQVGGMYMIFANDASLNSERAGTRFSLPQCCA